MSEPPAHRVRRADHTPVSHRPTPARAILKSLTSRPPIDRELPLDGTTLWQAAGQKAALCGDIASQTVSRKRLKFSVAEAGRCRPRSRPGSDAQGFSNFGDVVAHGLCRHRGGGSRSVPTARAALGNVGSGPNRGATVGRSDRESGAPTSEERIGCGKAGTVAWRSTHERSRERRYHRLEKDNGGPRGDRRGV